MQMLASWIKYFKAGRGNQVHRKQVHSVKKEVTTQEVGTYCNWEVTTQEVGTFYKSGSNYIGSRYISQIRKQVHVENEEVGTI